MNWIHRLIELKYTEKTLKKDISEAQKFVVDEAMANNAIGQIANVEGARVSIRLVKVEHKPSDNMLRLEKILEERVTELVSQDDEAIYFKEMVDEFTKKVQENQASLKQRIDEMVANDKEGSSLSQLIQIEKDQMITGEVKPQVAVSLPKI
jgi:hypothetical protein